MQPGGALTELGIRAQPEAWQEVIDARADAVRAVATFLLERGGPLVFAGCGSSHHLGTVAATLFAPGLARFTESVPASEILLYPDHAFVASSTIVVAISRSGQTTETVEAARQARQRGTAGVIAVTSDASSPLASEADIALQIPAREQSIAMTASFTAMLLGLVWMLDHLGGTDRRVLPVLQRLPSLGSRTIETVWPPLAAQVRSQTFEQFIFLGSGSAYGIAREASLKMAELSSVPSNAYHALEFRHGPMAMMDRETLVVAFVGDESASYEIDLLREIQDQGVPMLAIAERLTSGINGLALDSGTPLPERLLLYAVCAQILALEAGRAAGVDPDHPRYLTPIVQL